MSCSFKWNVSSWDINKYKINVVFWSQINKTTHFSRWFPSFPDSEQWASVQIALLHDSASDFGWPTEARICDPSWVSLLVFWNLDTWLRPPLMALLWRMLKSPELPLVLSFPPVNSMRHSSIFPDKCPFWISLPKSVFSLLQPKGI